MWLLQNLPALLLATATGAASGCATGGARNATPGDAPFQLAPGDIVTLPDAATLRYVRVAADSRCPPDVQCIRAGDADVVFEFTPRGGAPIQVDVNLPEAPRALLGAWRLHLLSLEFGEAPRAQVRIDAAGAR